MLGGKGAPWDIKVPKSWEGTIGKTFPGSYDAKITFFGNFTTPEELGNIMYGYTGAAKNLRREEVLAGSVYAAFTGNQLGSLDDVKAELKDEYWIMKGFSWSQMGSL
jgi:hypothetical protein